MRKKGKVEEKLAENYFILHNKPKFHAFFVYGINLIFIKVLMHLNLIITTYFNLKP
jgi:hypothetical protein